MASDLTVPAKLLELAAEVVAANDALAKIDAFSVLCDPTVAAQAKATYARRDEASARLIAACGGTHEEDGPHHMLYQRAINAVLAQREI